MNNDGIRRQFDATAVTLFALLQGTFNAVPFDESSDLHQQLFVSEWEIDVVVRADVQALNAAIAGRDQTADQHDRDVGRPRVFFQSAAEFETTHHRHHHVADYQVGLKGKCQFDSLC